MKNNYVYITYVYNILTPKPKGISGHVYIRRRVRVFSHSADQRKIENPFGFRIRIDTPYQLINIGRAADVWAPIVIQS